VAGLVQLVGGSKATRTYVHKSRRKTVD
jgi:hypothetical protein